MSRRKHHWSPNWSKPQKFILISNPTPLHSRELQNTIDSHKPGSPNKTFTRAKREKIFRTLPLSRIYIQSGSIFASWLSCHSHPMGKRGEWRFRKKKGGGGREDGGLLELGREPREMRFFRACALKSGLVL